MVADAVFDLESRGSLIDNRVSSLDHNVAAAVAAWVAPSVRVSDAVFADPSTVSTLQSVSQQRLPWTDDNDLLPEVLSNEDRQLAREKAIQNNGESERIGEQPLLPALPILVLSIRSEFSSPEAFSDSLQTFIDNSELARSLNLTSATNVDSLNIDNADVGSTMIGFAANEPTVLSSDNVAFGNSPNTFAFNINHPLSAPTIATEPSVANVEPSKTPGQWLDEGMIELGPLIDRAASRPWKVDGTTVDQVREIAESSTSDDSAAASSPKPIDIPIDRGEGGMLTVVARALPLADVSINNAGFAIHLDPTIYVHRTLEVAVATGYDYPPSHPAFTIVASSTSETFNAPVDIAGTTVLIRQLAYGGVAILCGIMLTSEAKARHHDHRSPKNRIRL
jgi:hypothetical protein